MSIFASFAAVVVLPEPCRPASRTTAGGVTARSSAAPSPPMSAVSSRCATPASRSAMLTSRSAPWMFASVRRASPRIVFTIRDRRSVRFSSTGGRGVGVNCADAGDSTLRCRVASLRDPRFSLLAHALARRERAAARAFGAGGNPRALRTAYLARLRHAVGPARAALRFRAGALGDAVARGADLLDREPLPRARGHAGADPRARRRLRAAAGALPGACGCAVHAFDRIPAAPRARDGRLRYVHDSGAARASDDPDGAAAARRSASRAARRAAAPADDGKAAVPDYPRGIRVPHADARHRNRVFGNAFRSGDEIRPQDGVRRGFLAYFCGAPRRALSLRLAGTDRAALDARRLCRAAPRLCGQPFRARGDPAARPRLSYTPLPSVPGRPLWTTFGWRCSSSRSPSCS